MYTKIYIALSILLLPLLMSCGLIDEGKNVEPQRITYSSYAIESETNVNGALEIETHFPSSGLNVLYEFHVVNKLGEPVEGITVVYYQENGISIIFMKDHLKRYSSAFLYGTPRELYEVFPENARNSSSVENASQGDNHVYKVLLNISLIPLNEAEIPALQDAYYLQQFYLSDSAKEGSDFSIYCRQIEDIPEIIKGQTNITLNSASILISIMSPDQNELIEIASDRILDESFNFGEKLIARAQDEWGFRMNQAEGALIGLKSFFPWQASQYIYVKTQFEFYEIELENSRCQKYIVDVPEEVNDFLDTDFIEILEGKGLQVHSGLTPGNVTGNYFVDNWTNYETGTRYVNYSFQFINQTSAHQVEVRSAAEFSDATGAVAFISGSGPIFSIYSEQDHYINDSGQIIFIKTADIYSGELTQDGILNFQNGFIILKKENDYYDRFLNVGDSRVVYEADYLAKAVEMFPYNSVNLDPEQSFRRMISEMN